MNTKYLSLGLISFLIGCTSHEEQKVVTYPYWETGALIDFCSWEIKSDRVNKCFNDFYKVPQADLDKIWVQRCYTEKLDYGSISSYTFKRSGTACDSFKKNNKGK